MITAAATPTAAEPICATDRRGSMPTRPRSAASDAETAHATTSTWRVRGLVAEKIGVSRYRTTIPTTDHTACTIAEAATGAVVAVCVIHELKGQSASLPPTPTK